MPNKIYYVYCHRKKTDGKCFYIGKGKGLRYKTTSSRNRHWYDLVDIHGFTTEILINNISEQKSFELEATICKKIGYENLVNIRTETGWGGHSHSDETITKLSKPILQYTKQGKFLKEWPNSFKAALSLNKHSAAITECCRGLRKSIYGYIWRHKNNPINEAPIYIPKKDKKIKNPPYYHPINQYDLKGNFIKTWNNIKTASINLNIKSGSISNCINGIYKSSGGYTFLKLINKKGGHFA